MKTLVIIAKSLLAISLTNIDCHRILVNPLFKINV